MSTTHQQQLEAEVARLREANAQLEQDAADADEDAQAFEKALKKAKGEIAALQKEVASLRADLEQARKMQQQQPSANKATAAVQQLQDEIKAMRAANKATVRKLEANSRILEARIDGYEEKIFETQQIAERAEQDAMEADKDAELFEKHARDHEAKCILLTKELNDARAQLATVTKDLLASQKTVASLNARVEALEKQKVTASHMKPAESPAVVATVTVAGSKDAPRKPLRSAGKPLTDNAAPNQQKEILNARIEATPVATQHRPRELPEPSHRPLGTQPSHTVPKHPHPAEPAAVARTASNASNVILRSQAPKGSASLATHTSTSTSTPKASGIAIDAKKRSAVTSSIPKSTRARFSGVATSATKKTGKAAMLAWCQRVTAGYKDVDVTNFSSSFADGMAFVAMMHHYFPKKIDLKSHTTETQEHNFKVAFEVADKSAGVYPLLDVEDMVAMSRPDALSVMTYLSQLKKGLGN